MTAVLLARNLHKSYSSGPETLPILRGLDLQVAPGEALAVLGASGSGKTTLLSLLGGLDAPDDGHDGCRIEVVGHSLLCADEDRRARIRGRHLGFVYQFHHLLAEFSALENVALPLRLGGARRAAAHARAADLLRAVGLEERGAHRPAQLSGGERQRVAVARALVREPDCVLLDEPTGNLDAANAMRLLALLDELRGNGRTGFVFVTHDAQLAAQMDRRLELREGRLFALD